MRSVSLKEEEQNLFMPHLPINPFVVHVVDAQILSFPLLKMAFSHQR
ncbi:hypothetical protein CMALT394_400001 [Carnobacterium maltaromaticum]|nr:hypothetical protein CMALT394_400001 [Carnobacterium maltaromaticum]